MTKIEIVTGDWGDATDHLYKFGGQLFPTRSKEHSISHVRGAISTTFWPAHSPVRGRTMLLADQLGYDPHTATTSRLAKHVTNTLCQIPHKGTEMGWKWKRLARGGKHWHYLYHQPGLYDWAVELDVKSAYWASFLTGESTLLGPDDRWIDDGGAFEHLKAIMDIAPKTFRVAWLGSVASWRSSWYTRALDPKGRWTLERKERETWKFGALGSAAHRAIARTWGFMSEVHKLLREDTLRIHTDGVIVNCTNGMDWEEPLDKLFKAWGLDYSIKGFGHCWIQNSNSCVLGKKVAGIPKQIAEDAKRAGVQVIYDKKPPHEHRFWSAYPAGIDPDVEVDPVPIETQTALPLSIQPASDVPHWER